MAGGLEADVVLPGHVDETVEPCLCEMPRNPKDHETCPALPVRSDSVVHALYARETMIPGQKES